MSNLYPVRKRQKPPAPKHISKEYTDQGMLSLLDTCDIIDSCNDSHMGFDFTLSNDIYEQIDYFRKNLPTLSYVENQFLNFLFSNGLTTGDDEQDKKILEPFLYSHNIMGITNYEVLRSAVIESREYGRCGIRWLSYEDGIVLVPHDRYTSLQVWDKEYKGFKRTVAYAIALTDEAVVTGEEPLEIDREEYVNTGQLVTKNKDIIIVSPDEFINLRNNTSKENGESIFERDIQRFRLLSQVYERLNYDIKYDGPGRVIFWLKDDIISNTSNEMSTGEIISQLSNDKDKRAEKAHKELEQIANAIKNSTSDNVILSPSMFEDKIDHLPRVTKATEFFDWLNQEGVIIAQNFGISPGLIELGNVSGNVSMEKIIDNAMVNDIVPLREAIAVQISHVISSKLGVQKIYFNKYELKQNIDYSSEIFKLGQTASQLMNIKDAEGVTDVTAEETAKYVMSLIVKKLGGEVRSMANTTITSTREKVLTDDNEKLKPNEEENE